MVKNVPCSSLKLGLILVARAANMLGYFPVEAVFYPGSSC